MEVVPWKVSLHGGHSGAFCDHARGTLEQVLETAEAQGFATYGVSEHAPRYEARFLYPEERALGWDVPRLLDMFEAYSVECARLQRIFEGRLIVLRGFEAEVVPAASWIDRMKALRRDHAFDFVVGSVHHVGELQIDGLRPWFEEAIAAHGGLEPLAMAYYDQLGAMIEALEPDVVGHFDLIRKLAGSYGSVNTPRVRERALVALEAAGKYSCILDLNTAGYRKGLDSPYPEPWLVEAAREAGVPFCFGDDSHGPDDVGRDLDRSREYLLGLGVDTITAITRRDGKVVREVVPLVAEVAP